MLGIFSVISVTMAPGKDRVNTPPQTDISEDGVPNEESFSSLSRRGGRFSDAIVPVSGPVVMGIPVRRTPGVPLQSIPEELPPLG